MSDMSAFKKQTPAQQRERLQWILDTVREHQELVEELLYFARTGQFGAAQLNLDVLHKQDRDALLQPGGILTDEQIKILQNTRISSNPERDQ